MQPQEDPIDLAQSVARDIAHIIRVLADRGAFLLPLTSHSNCSTELNVCTGAQHFLVPSVPALGYSPWSRTHRPGTPGSGTSDPEFFALFVRTFREYFASLVRDWQDQHGLLQVPVQGSLTSVGQLPLVATDEQGLPPRAQVVFWQQEDLYRDLAHGTIGNFTHVKQACLTVEREPRTGEPTKRHVCADPDTYLCKSFLFCEVDGLEKRY